MEPSTPSSFTSLVRSSASGPSPMIRYSTRSRGFRAWNAATARMPTSSPFFSTSRATVTSRRVSSLRRRSWNGMAPTPMTWRYVMILESANP